MMDLFIPDFCGMGLHLRLDGFRMVYCLIAVFMWAVSGAFSREYMAHYENRGRYYFFLWATFFATLGVFLSADLYTTFLFFEIMSFTSYVWVAFDQRRASLRAAETYLAVAVIGGLVLLMGLFLLYDQFGTLEMDDLARLAGPVLSGPLEGRIRLYAAGGMLLFGFGAKAGCFPLHIWLPKAHPEAPAPASALLSGILTKAGVFGIIFTACGLFGADQAAGALLTLLGLVTMLLGAVLALFSVNLKRTLACSSVSQIGFILTGIGMACLLRSAGAENLTAVHGAFLHMVNHSSFKLVLFLCAGVVFMNLHQLDLNEIRGFGRRKPALLAAFLSGALGIGGVPLFSGYISKTLLHESIVAYQGLAQNPGLFFLAEWVFLLTGGMTVAYMLKLFVALFVEKNEDPRRQRAFDEMGPGMGPLTTGVLLLAAAVPPVLGLLPHWTMDPIADLGQGFFYAAGTAERVAYFAPENLRGAAISIGLGAGIYVFVVRGLLMRKEGAVRCYVNRWPQVLDLEELVYRPLLLKVLPAIFGGLCQALDRYLVDTVVKGFLAAGTFCSRVLDSLVDGFIRLLRRTTHRPLGPPKEMLDSDPAAHLVGGILDRAAGFFHKTPKAGSITDRLARDEERAKGNLRLIQESFSYGLLLACIGLCLTLGYLLLSFWGR